MAHRLGLTGGIGSGKSTVSAILAQMGATIIDADAISRATTAAGGSAIPAVEAAFGVGLLTAEGALDRVQMRNLVYAEPSAKVKLEAIVHPLVGRAIAEQARQADIAGARCIVFDIPLLIESNHWRTHLGRVLVVDCSEECQITRITARNGLTAPEVRQIIEAQVTRSRRLAAADIVVFNDGISIDDLRQHVHEIGTQFGL